MRRPKKFSVIGILEQRLIYLIDYYKDAESPRDDTLFSAGEFSGIVENSKELLKLIQEIQENPGAVIQRGKDEGWLE